MLGLHSETDEEFQAFVQTITKTQNIFFVPEDVLFMIKEMYLLKKYSIEQLIEKKYNEIYKKFIQFRDRHVKYFYIYDNIELLLDVFIQEKRKNKNYKLSLYQKQKIVEAIFKNGDLTLLSKYEIVFELHRERDFTYAMLAAVESNNFETLKWVHVNLDENHYDTCNVAKQAIRRGNLEIVKYIYEHKLWDATDFSQNFGYSELDYVCLRGHLHLLEWFTENKHLLAMPGSMTACYDKAIQNGHIHILKWMDERYDCEVLNSTPVSVAAASGRLPVLKYIYETKKETKIFQHISWFEVTIHGQLEVLKWYKEVDEFFFLQIFNRALKDTKLIETVTNRGHAETLDWLYSTIPNFKCEVTKSDALEMAMFMSSFFGHVSVVKWFYDHFQIEKEIEVEIIRNLAKRCNLEKRSQNLDFMKSMNFHQSSYDIETLIAACVSGDMEMIDFVISKIKMRLDNNDKLKDIIVQENGEIVIIDDQPQHVHVLDKVIFSCRSLEVVKWVHDHCRIINQDYHSTLNYAAHNTNPEIFKWLFTKSVYNQKMTDKVVQNIKNIDTIEWLLDQLENSKSPFTPEVYVMFAIFNDYDVVKLFLSRRMPFCIKALTCCNDERILEMFEQNMDLVILS